MKESKIESHEFAFYSDLPKNIALLKPLDIFEVADKELYHRLVNVVRLRVEDIIILFNSKLNIRCTILATNKDKLTLRLEQFFFNKSLLPKISWLLPLLKKEAFEDSLYSLTEIGAQEIWPVITRKSQQIAPYLESDRVTNIMKTAAEQSKQFILPEIHNAQTLDKILESLKLQPSIPKIFFDPEGVHFFDVIKNLKQNNASSIICAIGPEGDLTESEKQLLKNHNFEFCKLTETILRAKQAVVVATGILRSLL